MSKLDRKPRNAAASLLSAWLVTTLVLVACGAVSTPIGVRGPTSTTNNAIPIWSGTGGTDIANSGWTIPSGVLTAGGNIALGSNYLSGDGQNEGVYVGSSGIVGIGTSSLTGIFVTPSLCVGGSTYISNGGRLIMDGSTDLLMQFATSGAFKGQWKYDVDWNTSGGMLFNVRGDANNTPLSIDSNTAVSVATDGTKGAYGNTLGVGGDIASYKAFTNASNYDRGRLYWNSNVLTLATEEAGTYVGSNRNIAIVPDGGLIGISGTGASYPALKRSSTELQVRLADDSGPTALTSTKAVTVDTDGGTYTASDCADELYCNTGDADGQTVNLPDAAAGLTVTFYCTVAQNFDINPQAGDQILSLTDAAGDAIRGSAIGASVTLTAIDSTNWAVTSSVGTWTDID